MWLEINFVLHKSTIAHRLIPRPPLVAIYRTGLYLVTFCFLTVNAALFCCECSHVTWYSFCTMQPYHSASTDPFHSIACHIKRQSITVYLINYHPIINKALLHLADPHVIWHWFSTMQTMHGALNAPHSIIGCHIERQTLLNVVVVAMYFINDDPTINKALLHPVYPHMTWY